MEKETMVATVPQAEIVDEQQLSRDVTDIEFQAESLVIQNDEDYAFAGEFGKMLKKKASQVTTFFKPMKDSAYQAHKAVCDREKAMLTPLRNAEKTVKQVMSAYIAEQERKRREAEEAARRAAEAERERKIQEAATLEAAGDAGYAPAGQDIVCAGASTLMQALVYLLAGEESARSDAWDEPEGPRLAVAAQAPVAPWVQGAFELAKAGFTLLAERYPDNLRFADVSRSGQQSMMDLQLFAEGEVAPALSPEQSRQAVAAGTLKPEAPAAQTEVPQQTPAEPEPQPESPAQPERPVLPPLPLPVENTVRGLHARWAAEEAAMRRSQPGFDLKAELKNPEMRRLMQLPGMRVQDAYRLAHYEDALRTTAQTVEQGVVERVQQRAARPLENGLRPGAAASVRPDVAAMTRAQREALERRVLHGAQIEL